MTCASILSALTSTPSLRLEKTKAFSIFAPVDLILRSQSFNPPGFIQDAFKKTLQGFAFQGTAIILHDSSKNFLFPFRVIDRKILPTFNFSDFNHATRAFAE